jgi:DNA (cytosine-5)-methyltransferase 1
MKHRFPYKWTLADANFTKDKGKVFSCFACGGGSTMGYKLAGFDVLGCNEIDPKMIEAYKANHSPKYAYLEPIQTFKLRDDLPQELYELDILDGSPPCSSFSMAGNREKDWGKEKKFREGQAEQVLDNLFFDFIDLAKKLQPKVVIAENVKGLLLGNAKEYVRKIYREFDLAGYHVQHWLLDASKMGVPQRRERVFFIAMRKDLAEPFMVQKDMFTFAPNLKLEFNEPQISIRNFVEFEEKKETQNYSEGRFGDVMLNLDVSANTITSGVRFWLNEKMILKSYCYNLIGSYPTDYKFNSDNVYMIGMSVPPVMTAQIATEVYNQWISKL